MKLIHRAAAASVAALLLSAVATMASEPPKPKDLNNFQCKDIMILSGADRDISIAFVHGYMLGKNKSTRYEVDKLATITDAFLDYCLDHPAENALASFEKVYK